MTFPASLSKWAHPPRSNTPRSSSSSPPGACTTPSTEICVVVVSFMVRPFYRVQVSGVTTVLRCWYLNLTSHLIFAALCAFIKLEGAENHKLNHVALKSKFYIAALHSAYSILLQVQPIQF